MKTAFEVGFSKIMNYFQIISLTMRVQNHNAGGGRETHYRVIRALNGCNLVALGENCCRHNLKTNKVYKSIHF